MKSEGGSDDMENLITLCRPCHGVQHPDNDTFDGDRSRADTFPNPSAESDVSYMNSETPELSVEEFISNLGHSCSRCGVSSPQEFDYYTYPDFTVRGKYRPKYPTDELGVVCERCVLYVINADVDFESWESEPVNEIYSISDEEFTSPEEIFEKHQSVKVKASLFSKGKFAVFDPTLYDDDKVYYAKRVVNFMFTNPAIALLTISLVSMIVLWVLSRVGLV
jgi:hypothetical protein